MPVDNNVGPGGINASYGQRIPVNKFNTQSAYENRIYIAEDGNIVGKDGELANGGLANVVFEDGLAKISLDDSDYALLPVDNNGDVVANIGHRQNTLASLLALDGVDGEISLPTDKEGFVKHNGVVGGAKFWKRLDNDNALGTNSVTIGVNSDTYSDAYSSIAAGPNATATTPGQTAFASAKKGIGTSKYTVFTRTLNDTAKPMTVNGVTGVINLCKTEGLFDVNLTVMARQVGTNNWARLVRRFVVIIDEDLSTTILSDITSPTPDINSGLAGLSVSPTALFGGNINISVTGLVSTDILWSGFVESSGSSYEVLI